MLSFRHNRIWVIGDTHGLDPVADLLDHIPDGEDIVHVGDLGLGFGAKDTVKLHVIAAMAKKHNKRVFVVRGNHDDPGFWPKQIDESLWLVEDYSTAQFPNKKYILFVGGGLSLDRCKRTEGESYWPDELTPRKSPMLPKIEVVIAHDCPSFVNNPTETLPLFYLYYVKTDKKGLMRDAVHQRETMDLIFDRVRPKIWIYGHYHNSMREIKEDCDFFCMDIEALSKFEWKKCCIRNEEALYEKPATF